MENVFPCDEDGNAHPRQAFLDKTVAALECQQSVEKIIRECCMYFDREPIFDMDPMIFQLQNCVVDLATNTIRRGRPSDMTSKCSPVTIPSGVKAVGGGLMSFWYLRSYQANVCLRTLYITDYSFRTPVNGFRTLCIPQTQF